MNDDVIETLPPGLRRRERRTQCLLTLNDEAVEVLDQLAPGVHKRGEFISLLLLAERARREERQRVKAEMAHGQ